MDAWSWRISCVFSGLRHALLKLCWLCNSMWNTRINIRGSRFPLLSNMQVGVMWLSLQLLKSLSQSLGLCTSSMTSTSFSTLIRIPTNPLAMWLTTIFITCNSRGYWNWYIQCWCIVSNHALWIWIWMLVSLLPIRMKEWRGSKIGNAPLIKDMSS